MSGEPYVLHFPQRQNSLRASRAGSATAQTGRILSTAMRAELRVFFLCGVLLASPGASTGAGDDRPRSLALKDHTLQTGVIDYGRDRSGEELVDIFHLVEDANAGNPVAQHQLGLRYLLGKGFAADTAKAAEWIGRAAKQNQVTAKYNFGILLNNGWGVPWNPFEAYRNILYAAQRGMAEAQYLFGLFYLDNLAVQRDYAEAYRWIASAADSAFAPAVDLLSDFARSGVLAKIQRKEPVAPVSSRARRSQNTRAGNAVIPLPEFMSDSLRLPDDSTLVMEAVRSHADDAPDRTDSLRREEVIRAAGAGSPEALTLVGRWYETGSGVPPDAVIGAAYYLRAVRFDSPRAPLLLDTMIRRDGFFSVLKDRVEKSDPFALFVWSGLQATGFDRQITETQALEFLRRAASDTFPSALVALAMCYYDGRWVTRDRAKARTLLDRARVSGDTEAAIRLLVLDITQDSSTGVSNDVRAILGQAASNGSVLAESMLGYCYQYGKGGSASVPDAVKYYRKAARRGSVAAYEALKTLYDEQRPDDELFRLRPSAEEQIGK